MKPSTRAHLSKVERLLRPGGTGQLRQADVLAANLDPMAALLREQSDAIAALRVEVAALRAEVAAMTGAAPPAAGELAGAPAAEVDDRNDRYNDWTFEIIERVLGEGGNAIDVGAHAGAILAPIVAASPTGRHLAFEPLTDLADALRESFPDVDVHQVALSDHVGTVEFHHVVDAPEFSGIQQRTLPDDSVEIRRVTVDLARLDDLVDEDQPISFVKIDVEGAELGVLRGGADLWARDRPVTVFEFGLGAADVYGTTPADVHGFFAELDMDVWLLDDWLADRPALGADGLAAQFAVCENYYFVAAPARGTQR